MTVRTLAHLSDLHIGGPIGALPRVEPLRDALLDAGIDHVVVTGDLTDAGRAASFDTFRRVFEPLIAAGRMTLVPGNHDRLGDDIGSWLMDGRRVDAVEVPGAYLVRVDSTGPHNRVSLFHGHGVVCDGVLDELDATLDRAPAGALVVVLMHHHPLPLPEESLLERISTRLGWPNAAELPLGEELLRRALGRCDLVLHGHRHHPCAFVLDGGGPRPLRVFNAGSSVLRAGMNVFSHCAGTLVGMPRWLTTTAQAPTLDRVPYQATPYSLSRRPG